MIPVYSADSMRQFDRHASEARAVPSLLLMENAGRGAAEVVLGELADRKRAGEVVIVAGPGNNGGDGFVVARRLLTLGKPVVTFVLGEEAKLRGDARVNYGALCGAGGTVEWLSEPSAIRDRLLRAALVVDALFGTGLDREVEGPARELIELVNGTPAPKIALDVPSGLHADTGRVLGVAVKADVTVTFAAPKLGLCTPRGAEHAGRLEVRDIGLPLAGAVAHQAELLERGDIARLLGARAVTTHKVSAGRLIVLAGSPGKVGAALLVAHGALRAGAGLVTVASTAEAARVIEQRTLEAMTARVDAADLTTLDRLLSNANAVTVGPGLGLDEGARRLVDRAVLEWEGVKVLDADAISHFAGRAAALKGAPGSIVMTPHAGELARLLGKTSAQIEDDRFAAVREAVDITGATVLLKGRYTVVGAPERPVLRINPTGSAVLATGGTGDVLAGIVGALACTIAPDAAACAGAYLHGLAGEMWANEHGADRGLLAHELADRLPKAFSAVLSAAPDALPV